MLIRASVQNCNFVTDLSKELVLSPLEPEENATRVPVVLTEGEGFQNLPSLDQYIKKEVNDQEGRSEMNQVKEEEVKGLNVC